MRAKTLQIIWHSKDPVFSIDFHPDGYFATGGADREIKIWELSCAADGTPGVRHAASLEGHNATVNCVRFSKTGHYMASAGDSGEVIIWKPIPAAGTAAADGSGSPRSVTPPLIPGSAAAAATSGGALASTPAREAAAEAADSSREENAVRGLRWKMAHTLRGHHDDVTDIAWAHDDAVLLTGSVENEVMLFDVHSRQNLQRLLGHRHYVQGVAWDPLGAWLVSASADRSVRVHGLKPPPSGGKGSTAVKSSVQLAREFIHSATLLKRAVQAPATPPRDAAAPASPVAAASSARRCSCYSSRWQHSTAAAAAAAGGAGQASAGVPLSG
ncbi:WD40-repeat-containing domain protein [Scenedesmus sp. NREL 46B-D3]|nr:WD40-repeat-containing domain protein [Scenedesmus sp. NREL 46B-D3]